MAELPWYSALREQHRPPRVRLLLIGESAPDPAGADRRFFYAPILTQHDNLFRGVVEALYGTSPGCKGDEKGPWLRRLKDDGTYLIDLVPFPVNKLTERLRRAARREHAPECVSRARALDPLGVVVCHAPSFDDLAEPMRRAGVPLLHDDPIPFPLGFRAEFIAGVRAAVGRLAQPSG